MNDDQPKSQMLSFMVPNTNFGYTGANVATLASFENTLTVGLFDESGSTTPFARQMELCIQEIIKGLRTSPRASNLMYAQYHFDTSFREFHGFKPLIECNEADYDGCWGGGGKTTFYDSLDKVLRFILDYARQQAAQHYVCNGILYVLTDGCDFGSTLTQRDNKKTLAEILTAEELESLLTVMIGINPDPGVQKALEATAKEIGFSAYIPVEKADEKTLAKISGFVVSQSVSQSQHLGSGGPSQVLKF